MGITSFNQTTNRYQSDSDEPDMIGSTLEARDGHLYFRTRAGRHPIKVMATTHTIHVGCTSLTREAWELLKHKVDGEHQ